MDNRITFHIQHTAKPIYLEKLLISVNLNDSIDANQLEVRFQNEGVELAKGGVQRTLDLANKLGIITKTSTSKFTLEPLGLVLRKLALYKHDVYTDVLHYLFYALWELHDHQDYWSWSYSKICELFWEYSPRVETKKVMFGQISALAANTFPELDAVLGTETIIAVSNWLNILNPPFFIVDNEKVIRCKERDWFSPELALLGILYLYTIKNVSISTPILLEKTTIDLLVPLCLTSHETIISMVEIASKTYPFLEIHIGEWGSSVILTKALDITMIG